MLKKFSLLIVGLCLLGCRSTSVSTTGGADASSTDISELNIGGSNDYRVGILLPLSGEASRYGQGLKKASMLALEDVKNPNLILQYYDTKSTPEGARVAIENALNQKAKVILGPLKSSSVAAVAPAAKARNVPVIAFSTSEKVLEPGIYTLGLLVDEQVDRIVSYAAGQGRSRLALLLPDNETGIAVARAALNSAGRNQIQVTRIAFYPPNTSDFSDVLKKMTDYGSRNSRMQSMRAGLETKARAGDAEAQRALKQTTANDAIGGVDFDMVLIPESGARLKSAVAMFSYYDVAAPQVKFLGTSIWETSKLNNETTLIGSWYPAMSRSHSDYFNNKYSNVFGERASSLYTLAYDAVALSNAMATQSGSDETAQITNPDGYVGLNGMFRIFGNGHNQHSMNIMEVTKSGDAIVDAAPKRFEEDAYSQQMSGSVLPSDYIMPMIIGKDSATARALIYGSGNNY